MDAEERKAYMKAYYKANKERLRVQQKAYNDSHKEQAKAKRDERRSIVRDEDLARQRRWREANREDQLGKQRSWRLANKDRKAAADRAYRSAQPARVAATKREWAARNAEKTRGYRANHYKRYLTANRLVARLRAHTRRDIYRRGSVAPGFVVTLMRLQKCKCANCAASIKDKFHIDHITPIARGGEHAEWNLQLLCPRCNHKKGAKDPVVWAQQHGRLL